MRKSCPDTSIRLTEQIHYFMDKNRNSYFTNWIWELGYGCCFQAAPGRGSQQHKKHKGKWWDFWRGSLLLRNTEHLRQCCVQDDQLIQSLQCIICLDQQDHCCMYWDLKLLLLFSTDYWISTNILISQMYNLYGYGTGTRCVSQLLFAWYAVAAPACTSASSTTKHHL